MSEVAAVLGLPPDAPEVAALCRKAGKVTVKSDFIIAKDAGLEFALAKPEGQKKKVVHTAFLYAQSERRPHGFAGLSAPFSFTSRATLHQAAGTPAHSFVLGKGQVPPTTKVVDRDTWTRDEVTISASYDDDLQTHTFILSRPAPSDFDLHASPLHFEAEPVDAPPHATKLPAALLLAWASDRFGLPASLASHPLAKGFLARKVTPVTFFSQACGGRLNTRHLHRDLAPFLKGYLERLFLTADDGARAAMDAKVTRLLKLSREDERAFDDDYRATFAALGSLFYTPDDWTAVDALGAVLDARWADYRATRFEKPGPLTPYTVAAKRRAAVKVSAARAAPERRSVDAASLLACVGKSLTDSGVKAALEAASLPVGKRIDEQANPAAGISYLGARFAVGAKHVLGVNEVSFFAAGVSKHVRGLGRAVTFAAFEGPTWGGVRIGMKRAAVVQLLGAPASTSPEADVWKPRGRRVRVTYSKGTVASVTVGLPLDF